jgi:hypothetical protein
MTILSYKNSEKKEDYKLVGVKLSLRARNYLVLFSLAKEIPKARIIRNLVEPWVSEQRTKEPDSELIREIIQSINIEWKVEKKSTKSKMTFLEFKQSIEFTLTKKGLPDLYIKLILQQIKE